MAAKTKSEFTAVSIAPFELVVEGGITFGEEVVGLGGLNNISFS